MQATVRLAFDNFLLEFKDTSENCVMSEHAKKVEQLNWSWAISLMPFPFWRLCDLKENLTDVDSMSINAAKAEAFNQPKPDPFLYLEHFVIDLQNNVAYKKNRGFEMIFMESIY